MARYSVNASVVGGMYIGEYEAESPARAIEMAEQDASVTLCHQCADKVSDLEIEDLTADLVKEVPSVDPK